MNNITVNKHENKITIQVVGEFTYELHKKFRDSYRDEKPTSQYVIDLAKTKSMDSSALGMLLLLRQHAGEDKSQIRIINHNPQIKNILKLVRFDELFAMND